MPRECVVMNLEALVAGFSPEVLDWLACNIPRPQPGAREKVGVSRGE